MLYRLGLLCLLVLVGCTVAGTTSPIASPVSNIPPPTIAITNVVPTAVPTLQLPTVVPTLLSTSTPPAPTPTPIPPTPLPQPVVLAPTYPEEILFLRGGSLVAIDPSSNQERVLANNVRDVAIDLTGRHLAVASNQTINLIDRSSGSVQTLVSGKIAYGLSWAPDGLTLAYAAAPQPPTLPFDWMQWSNWCATATVYLIDLPTLNELTIGSGCDPVFASDGRRLAFATSPSIQPGSLNFPGQNNAIRLVNRAGANAWNLATANGSPGSGYLVYRPAWLPDAKMVAYQRFLGYQALVDLNLTMITDSSGGTENPTLIGTGWLRPPAFSPDGQYVASVEYNFSDPRGFSGYDIWEFALVQLKGQRSEILPSGNLNLFGTVVAQLPRITSAAWSPQGDSLVVLTPENWNATADPNDPLYSVTTPGELWRLSTKGLPQKMVTNNVDYASPLIWAPEDLVTAQIGLATIRYPAYWQFAPVTNNGELVATGNGRFIGRRTVANSALLNGSTWMQTVSDWISVAQADPPYQLPDGSYLVTFSGQAAGSAISGVARFNANTIIISYAPVSAWPNEQAWGIGLAFAAQ
ncbi:MAG: hypothetical protein C0184_16805 [Chloroflexus aggregans]|uniref:WD40 domain protein beta Propeller n=1 Tax=Chloroflexus aggregans TaxID=152260 RepID=A0A2J6WRB2_9CHLR|nr:MAG: hypothetical protein C0184_16805 [Chloroflexus aggregans]